MVFYRARRQMFFPDLDEEEIHADPATAPASQLETDGEKWTVTYQNERWSIPFENIGADSIAVTVTKECAYVAPYSSTPSRYSLFAIDRARNKILWTAKVWSQGGFGGFSGRHYQEVEIRILEHEILVFGISDPAIYIEGFDLKTGKNLWRFGSSYLEYKVD